MLDLHDRVALVTGAAGRLGELADRAHAATADALLATRGQGRELDETSPPAVIPRSQRLLIARWLRAVGNQPLAASLEPSRGKLRVLVDPMADFCWAGVARIGAGA
jgi:NAD(P)-dependent dehydrogenase (short-subunit alcohol dehydrogenase family)